MSIAYRIPFFAIPLLLFSGCFLSQEAPQQQAAPVVPAPTVSGLVTLIEERIGDRAAAELTATFGPVAPSDTSGSASQVSHRGSRAALMRALASARQASPRGTDCQRQAGVVGNTGTDNTVYYDAGTIGFGAELQSTLEPLIEDPTTHAYHLDLTPPFPPGSYLVHTSPGTAQVAAFDADLAMPEELEGVTANGSAITQSGFTIKRSTALEIEWQPPVTPNDQSMMLLLIVTQNSSEEQALQCMGYESDVSGTASSVATWTIDAEWLADLINSTNAQIYFVRQISRQGTSGNMQIELDGIRVWQTQITIAN